MSISSFAIITVIIATTYCSYGQGRQLGGSGRPSGVGSSGGSANTNANGASKTIEPGPDTTIYQYVNVRQYFFERPVSDTALDMDFLHSNPIDRSDDLHINLGNRASASMPLAYDAEVNVTWQPGYHAYDLHDYSIDNFKFFNGNRPLSQLYFSQLGTQANLNVGADFSTSFKDGLSMSINYDRVAYGGYFKDQTTFSTHFGFGLRYFQPKHRYQAFLLFLRNSSEELQNGGLADLSKLRGATFPTLLEVRLDDASSRYQNQTFAYIQYLRLNSAKTKNWNINLANELIYRPSYFKYSDDNINSATDTLVYGTFINDDRGFRSYLDVDRYTIAGYLDGSNMSGLSGRAGIEVDYFSITNNPQKINRTDISATFDGIVPIAKRLFIDTKAKLGLGANAGNFDARGQIALDISKKNTITAGIRFFNSEPSYQNEFLIVNNQTLFEYDYDNTFGTTLYGKLNIPFLRTKLSLDQHVVNKAIYWDNLGHPQQSGEVLSITNASVNMTIPLWKFRIENHVTWQIQSSRIFPLPTYFGSHQLYFESYLFKKALLLKTGFDVRWIDAYKGPQFFPLTQTFGLSEGIIPNYPFARFFIMGKVARFRASFSMENIDRYFSAVRNNYYVQNYALFSPQLNMTFGWVIND